MSEKPILVAGAGRRDGKSCFLSSVSYSEAMGVSVFCRAETTLPSWVLTDPGSPYLADSVTPLAVAETFQASSSISASPPRSFLLCTASGAGTSVALDAGEGGVLSLSCCSLHAHVASNWCEQPPVKSLVARNRASAGRVQLH